MQHRVLPQRPDVEARAAVTDRVLLLADAIGSARARFQGLLMTVSNDVRRGALDVAARNHTLLAALTERAAEPVWRWHTRLVEACLAELGEPGSGDAAAEEAARLGRRYGIPDGAEAAAVWAFLRAYTSGTLAALGSGSARAAAEREEPGLGDRRRPVPRATANSWSRDGITEPCWTGRASGWCTAAYAWRRRHGSATTGCAGGVAVVAPFSGQWVVLGSASSCFGPVDRFLALAADGSERDRLFAAAWAQASAVCSATWQMMIDRDAGHCGAPSAERIGSS